VIAVLLLFAADAPLIGRPVEWPFSGAIAGFVREKQAYVAPFRLTTEAQPRVLNADEPLLLTVTIQARGMVQAPPQRIDLGEVPAFAKSFHLSDVSLETPATPGVWVWRYRLVPRGPWVSEVPSFPFLFYNPDFTPAERGYQLLFGEAIPLTVRPAEKLGPPPDFPAVVTQPVPDEQLYGRARSWEPGLREAVLALLVPPLGCWLWYEAWRRLYPDAARQAALRRGRALRRALDALRQLPADPAARAEQVLRVVETYLRDRWDLRVASPTPEEVAAVIASTNEHMLILRLHTFWQSGDAIRFGQSTQPLPTQEVRRLLLDLEEAAWRFSS
jgi:hypothetical protein